MLSKLVITFLPRSKRLLISWLQSLSAVILKPQKIKSDAVSTVSPSISHEVIGVDRIFEGVMVKSFPSLLKNVDPRISMNSKYDKLKEIHTRHIIGKLSKDRILKEAE